MRKGLKILIGSCGGLTGLYLSKYFRKKGKDFFIVGVDVNERIPTKKFVDILEKIPPATDESNFLEELVRIYKKYKIDVYIPTHSRETEVVSKHQKKLINEDLKFVVSPFSTFEILDDKLKAYEFLSRLGIKVPKVLGENPDKLPAFVKPRKGSGSKKTLVVDSKELYENLFRLKSNEFVFLEYIEGEEYTVDMFFDRKGDLIGLVPRRRIKTLGGAAVITVSDFSIEDELRMKIEIISSKLKIFGPANFQFFRTKEGLVFTDFNLRFASGGMPLAVELGLNLPELTIKVALNKSIDSLSIRKDSIVMYRYFEEFFEKV